MCKNLGTRLPDRAMAGILKKIDYKKEVNYACTLQWTTCTEAVYKYMWFSYQLLGQL